MVGLFLFGTNRLRRSQADSTSPLEPGWLEREKVRPVRLCTRAVHALCITARLKTQMNAQLKLSAHSNPMTVHYHMHQEAMPLQPRSMPDNVSTTKLSQGTARLRWSSALLLGAPLELRAG